MAKDQPNNFHHRSLQDRESIVAYFEALKKGFDARRLLFCAGDKEFVLKPEGLLDFSVKAKRKDGESKVTLRISWTEREPGDEEEHALRIVVDGKDAE